MAKSPKERGHKPVMVTEAVYEALLAVKEREGLSSMSSALAHVLEALGSAGEPQVTAEWVEGLIAFARITDKAAQRTRDYCRV